MNSRLAVQKYNSIAWNQFADQRFRMDLGLYVLAGRYR